MFSSSCGVILVSIILFPGWKNIAIGLDSRVSYWTLFIIFLIPVFSAIVKGAVGFGSALIATPLIAMVIDPLTAVVILAVMPWMHNIFQIGDTNTGMSYLRDEWMLFLLAVVGTLMGLYFLSTFQVGILLPLLMGILIIAYVVYEFLTGYVTIEYTSHPVGIGIAGFVQGFLVAAANMGPVLPAYLHTFERDTERYVGAISMVYSFIYSLRIVLMVPMGLMTPYRLWLGSVIASFSIIGLLIGTYLRRLSFDQSIFERLVVVLLLIIGLNLLYQTIPMI